MKRPENIVNRCLEVIVFNHRRLIDFRCCDPENELFPWDRSQLIILQFLNLCACLMM